MGVREDFDCMVKQDPLLQELARLGEESPARQIIGRIGHYAMRFLEGMGRGYMPLIIGMTPGLIENDQP